MLVKYRTCSKPVKADAFIAPQSCPSNTRVYKEDDANL